MTNEQIQALKGNKVSDPYYLVECCNCGEMYPSNKFSGGGKIADTGDYADYSCPHCGETENFEDFGSSAEKAWNYQQKQIDVLLAERDTDKKRIAELEEREKRIIKLANDSGELCDRVMDALESRTLTVKFPEPLMPAQHNSGELFMTPDNVEQGGYLNCDDVLRALRKACVAAGIKLDVGGDN